MIDPAYGPYSLSGFPMKRYPLQPWTIFAQFHSLRVIPFIFGRCIVTVAGFHACQCYRHSHSQHLLFLCLFNRNNYDYSNHTLFLFLNFVKKPKAQANYCHIPVRGITLTHPIYNQIHHPCSTDCRIFVIVMMKL